MGQVVENLGTEIDKHLSFVQQVDSIHIFKKPNSDYVFSEG